MASPMPEEAKAQVVSKRGRYVGREMTYRPDFVRDVDLTEATLRVFTPNGEEYEVGADADGNLRLWLRGGGRIVTYQPSGNVLSVVNAGNFIPLRFNHDQGRQTPATPYERED